MTSLKLLLTCLILTLFNLNLAFSQISHDHSNTNKNLSVRRDFYLQEYTVDANPITVHTRFSSIHTGV